MIARVFPTRTALTPTDADAFTGPPPMGLDPPERVMVSVTFTWDMPRARFLADQWRTVCQDVQVGGPAFDDPGGEFTPGMFVRPGVVITSRGCPRRCPFCFVPAREGNIRLLAIKSGWDVQDNNLLACPRSHIEAVLAMLAGRRHAARFGGGLDARMVRPWFIRALAGLRIDRLFTAFDQPDQGEPVERFIRQLHGVGLRQRQIMVYMVLGLRGDTPDNADRRAHHIFDLGAVPFVQWVRDAGRRLPIPQHWKAVVRKWSRPAAMFAGNAVSDQPSLIDV